MRQALMCSFILLLAGMAAPGQTQEANYEIAFKGTCQRSFGICLMHPDGTQAHLLNATAVTYLQPGWWSPDGRKILYTDNKGVRVINSDGTGDEELPARLIGMDIQMVWSPDSTRVAFASAFEDPHLSDPQVQRGRQPYSTAVYVLTLQTKKVSRLSPLGQNRWISWAPDGRRLVYSSGPSATTKPGIYVVDSSGGVPRPVFSGSTLAIHPAWSSKADQIAFLAAPTAGGASRDNGGLLVVHSDGSARRRISPLFGNGLQWSPDGQSLLTNSKIVRATNGAAVDLAGEQMMIEATFAPDGHSVIYRTSDQGKTTISAIDVDGTHRRKLCDGSFFAVSPLLKP